MSPMKNLARPAALVTAALAILPLAPIDIRQAVRDLAFD